MKIQINSVRGSASSVVSFAGRSNPQLVIFNRNGRFEVMRPRQTPAAAAEEPLDPRLDQFVGRRIWGRYTDADLARDIEAALS